MGWEEVGMTGGGGEERWVEFSDGIDLEDVIM